jgi:hypothetical protein
MVDAVKNATTQEQIGFHNFYMEKFNPSGT